MSHPFHAADVDVDPDRAKALIDAGDVQLVDVREPHEFELGHIPGAVTHPLSTFDTTALAELIARDGRRPVFSCQSGVRSVHALTAAQGAGLAVTEHYVGGFKDWSASGEPVET